MVTNGLNSVSMISGGNTRPVVTHGDFDSPGPDVAADREATSGGRPGHRVHGVHHQVDEDLLQQHLIAADDARGRRQMQRCLDMPRLHVVGDEGQAR